MRRGDGRQFLVQVVEVNRRGYTKHTQWVVDNLRDLERAMRAGLRRAGQTSGIDALITEWDFEEDGFLFEGEGVYVLANRIEQIDEFCFNTNQDEIVVLG